MKKSTVKILSIVLLVVLLFVTITPIVKADTSFSDVTVGYIKSSAKDTTDTSDTVNKIIGAIMTVAQVIGVGVAVIMLIVLAIKYISAAPSDKAEIKKHAVVYVVGAVVLFAATGILQLVKQFAGIVNNNVNSAE